MLTPRARSQGIELIVPANTTGPTYNFQDIPELRSNTGTMEAIIFGISVHTVLDTPKTWTGNPVASYAQVQNAFLTLYVLGQERIFKKPMLDMLNIANDGSDYYYTNLPFQTEPMQVDWVKSLVTFADPSINGDTQFSYLFTVTYDWYPIGTWGKWLANQDAQRLNGVIKA